MLPPMSRGQAPREPKRLDAEALHSLLVSFLLQCGFHQSNTYPRPFLLPSSTCPWVGAIPCSKTPKVWIRK
eukprot:9485912-Pyramimonas_sp.AAC.1